MFNVRGAVAALVMAVLSLTAGVARAQTATELGCSHANEPQPWGFGRATSFTGCTAPRTPNDYGRVYLEWRPPAETDPAIAAMNATNRAKWARAIKRLIGIGDRRSGGIVLELYQRQPGTSPTSSGTLIYTRALAAFEVTNEQGVKLESLTSELTGPIGPYILNASQADGLEWRLLVKYSNRPLVQVVERLNAANRLVQAITGDPVFSVSDTLLQSATGAQREIAGVFGQESSITRIGQLGFQASQLQAATVQFSLIPTTAPTTGALAPDLSKAGSLTISIRNIGSILPGDHVYDTQGVGYQWGDVAGETVVRTREIDGKTLQSILSAGMPPEQFANLTSSDPGQFQAACSALRSFLQSSTAPRLNPYDISAVRWAFTFTGDNIGLPAVRKQSCAADFLGDRGNQERLASRGLRIRAINVTVPPRYETSRAQAQLREQEAIASARRGEDSFVAGAQAQGRGTVKLESSSINFVGDAADVTGGLLGVARWLTGDRSGDLYYGSAIRTDPLIAIINVSGSGRYAYAENPNSAAIALLAGSRPVRFFGQIQSGQPLVGRLEFADGSRFEGSFVEGAPFEGVMVSPDGVVRHGRFADYRMNGDGIERTKLNEQRWGTWTKGTLSVVNPDQ